MTQINYEIKNKKLKKILEKRAQKLGISVETEISRFIGRGLMWDNSNEDYFFYIHSSKILDKINKAIDLDYECFKISDHEGYKEKLEKVADFLQISVDEVIDRYIRRGQHSFCN